MSIETCLKTRKDYRDHQKVKEFIGLAEKYSLLDEKTQVMDLCCGNGMLGFYFLERYPQGFVYFLDVKQTNRFKELASGFTKDYQFIKKNLYGVEKVEGNLLLSIHACGSLTDKVMELGLKTRTPFAIMTCCHSKRLIEIYEEYVPRPFLSSLGLMEYIDLGRARKIRSWGRRCILGSIGQKTTKKNNILISF